MQEVTLIEAADRLQADVRASMKAPETSVTSPHDPTAGRDTRSARAGIEAALQPRGAKPRRKNVHTLGMRLDR